MRKDAQRFIIILTLILLVALSYALMTGVFSRGSGGEPKYKTNYEGKNGCCKICYKGVACGSGCVPRATRCEIETGCACNYQEEILSDEDL